MPFRDNTVPRGRGRPLRRAARRIDRLRADQCGRARRCARRSRRCEPNRAHRRAATPDGAIAARAGSAVGEQHGHYGLPSRAGGSSRLPTPGKSTVEKPRLNVNGDLRLRAQGDYGNKDGEDRDSAQIRGRLGATYAVNDRVTVGARLVTGDADDPNSTDVTLSNFDDDFQVSLDLAYAQINFGELKVYGGKIPQPFARTDLVWDGDVNPQGVSGVYKHALRNGGALRANGLFFVVDEQAAGPESTMLGGQLGYDSADAGRLEVRCVRRLLRLQARQHRGRRCGRFPQQSSQSRRQLSLGLQSRRRDRRRDLVGSGRALAGAIRRRLREELRRRNRADTGSARTSASAARAGRGTGD